MRQSRREERGWAGEVMKGCGNSRCDQNAKQEDEEEEEEEEENGQQFGFAGFISTWLLIGRSHPL